MRHALFLMILFLSLSCTSRSQARRDSINTLSDTLSTPDSIMSADTLRLLFVGDLMQHQGQINAARTATGTYDYSACFEYVKEEIGSVDLAIANLEVTLGGKPYKGTGDSQQPQSRPRKIRIGTYYSSDRLAEYPSCRYVHQCRRTRKEISAPVRKERIPYRPAQLYVWNQRNRRYSSQYRELY